MAGPLPPPSDPPVGAAAACAADFVAALVSDGLAGPVLIVATDDSVAKQALVWAEAFARIGWRYGVRVLSPQADAAEIADLAIDLGGAIGGCAVGVIVVAAPPELIDAVRRMAGAEGPPVVVWPPPSGAGNALPAD